MEGKIASYDQEVVNIWRTKQMQGFLLAAKISFFCLYATDAQTLGASTHMGGHTSGALHLFAFPRTSSRPPPFLPRLLLPPFPPFFLPSFLPYPLPYVTNVSKKLRYRVSRV